MSLKIWLKLYFLEEVKCIVILAYVDCYVYIKQDMR